MKKGVEKYFNSTVEERMQHECLQLILCKHPQTQLHGIKSMLEKRVTKRYNEYLNKEQMSLLVFSWNCAGNEPYNQLDIK